MVVRIIPSEAGSIFEIDANDQLLFFRAATGQDSDKIRRTTIPFGKGIVSQVAESQQGIVVPNTQDNAHHLKLIGQMIGFEAKDLMAVPIIIRGKTYGVVELLNRTGGSTFTPDDLELLYDMIGYIAKAIEVRLMINWTREHLKQAA